MRCPKCQKETKGAAFCGFCGTAIVRERPEESSNLGFYVKAALVLGAIYLIIVGLGTVLGGGERADRTAEEERAAIKECVKWGGKVLYDSQDKYRDCAINGRID